MAGCRGRTILGERTVLCSDFAVTFKVPHHHLKRLWQETADVSSNHRGKEKLLVKGRRRSSVGEFKLNSQNLSEKRKPNCRPSSQEAEGLERLTAPSLAGQLQGPGPEEGAGGHPQLRADGGN